MVTLDKRKLSGYLWISSLIVTVAVCGALLYISYSYGRSKVSLIQGSKHFLSSPASEMLTAEECVPVCDSKACVFQSKYLLDNMDTDVDPCENFFQFACGKIIENLGQEKYYTSDTRNLNMMTVMSKGILESMEANPRNASGKIKAVYDSCVKYSSDFQAVPTILDFLSGAGIRGWPNLAPDFQFDEPGLTRVIVYFLSYGEFGFVDFSTFYQYLTCPGPDYRFNSSLLDAKSPYEKHKKPDRKYLVDHTLTYFNLDLETISRIWEESEAIHDAVINLREESLRFQDKYEDKNTYLDCTQDNVAEWKDLCECLESLISITEANERVSKSFANIEGSSVYFTQNILPLLRNFSDRSIANYLALNVFFNNLDDLNFYFRLSKDKVTDHSLDGDVFGLKWTKCVKWILKRMTRALGHEYVKTHFPVPFIHDVEKLSEEVIRAGADLISLQEWMTEDERTKVKEEILGIQFSYFMTIFLLTNEEDINLFYKKFLPTDENFFQNVLDYKKWWRTLQMHGEAYGDELYHESTLTSIIEVIDGVIEVNLGMLMPPAYAKRLEKFMSLAGLGSIIAHEFGHNLEYYFKDHLNKSSGYYEDHLKCLENQYSQFKLDTIGKYMNGSRYVSENFGDITGSSILDKLIEKYASNNSSPLMPSLPPSLKQQMYVNSAQLFCTVHTKESDENTYKNDTHAADRFRLTGWMQNSKQFSEAFGCTEGSYMNPLKKCTLFV